MKEKINIPNSFELPLNSSPSREGPKTEEELKKLNYMLDKKESQDGIVIGFHGTSAKRAKEIEKNGFQNRKCVEGGYGVYFWDDEYEQNALIPAKDKADEDNDSQYAIIKTQLKNASPDFLMGRPQWLVNTDDIEILEVNYFKK